jgi:hypothetical protein
MMLFFLYMDLSIRGELCCRRPLCIILPILSIALDVDEDIRLIAVTAQKVCLKSETPDLDDEYPVSLIIEFRPTMLATRTVICPCTLIVPYSLTSCGAGQAQVPP